MRDIIKTVLSVGITIGLSDREQFIKEISGVIDQYQTDPQRGDQWAQSLVSYLEQAKNNINLENAIKGAMGSQHMPDKNSIEELTNAIKHLTHEMQQSKSE